MLSSFAQTATHPESASQSTPPSPPPGSYVRPVIEKACDSLETGETRAFLCLQFRETFNLPAVDACAGRLLPDPGQVSQLMLVKDENGDKTWDANETVIAGTVPDETGEFVFTDLNTVLEQNESWLVLAGIPAARDAGKTLSVEFEAGAFRGEDTYFDFPACRFGEFTVHVSNALKGRIPDRFEMSHNYPNPFNPETNFNLAMPEKGKLRIAVFNILGQEVAQLADRDFPAGWHTVSWDGRDRFGRPAPTGVYICRAVSGKFSAAVKIEMIR
ncbi:T9SS type A sorting domain-containing protein [bacterium]|nr:T9SS type A sorting domain-containing protein [bacterium]